MPEFVKRPEIVEASQWLRDGDHPEVRAYSHPVVAGDVRCEECGRRHKDHGWLGTVEEGHRVCPGDWIVQGGNGTWFPCKPAAFVAAYEPRRKS